MLGQIVINITDFESGESFQQTLPDDHHVSEERMLRCVEFMEDKLTDLMAEAEPTLENAKRLFQSGKQLDAIKIVKQIKECKLREAHTYCHKHFKS